MEHQKSTPGQGEGTEDALRFLLNRLETQHRSSDALSNQAGLILTSLSVVLTLLSFSRPPAHSPAPIPELFVAGVILPVVAILLCLSVFAISPADTAEFSRDALRSGAPVSETAWLAHLSAFGTQYSNNVASLKLRRLLMRIAFGLLAVEVVIVGVVLLFAHPV